MEKLKKFFRPYDWNVMLQEISTFAIVCLVTTIYFSREFLETRQWLVAISLVVAVFVTVKSLIYSNAVNFNLYKGVRRRYLYRPDSYDFAHEACTAVLGLITGCYLAPIFLSLFVFDRFWSPQLKWGVLVVVAVGALKIYLYSQTRKVVRKHDHIEVLMRRWLYIFPNLLIGFFAGCYLYFSGILFLPAEDHPDYYSPWTFERNYDLIPPIFGKEQVLREQYEYRSFASLWEDEFNGAYLKFAVLAVLISLLAKGYLFFKQSPQRQGATMRTGKSLSGKRKRTAGNSPPVLKRLSETGKFLGKLLTVTDHTGKSGNTGKTAKFLGKLLTIGKTGNIGKSSTSTAKPKSYRSFPSRRIQHAKPGAKTRASKQIGRTQEHRISGNRRKVIGKTREHKLATTGKYRMPPSKKLSTTGKYRVSARSKEYRLAATARHDMRSWRQPIDDNAMPSLFGEIAGTIAGVSTGILTIPLLRNAYFYSRSVYAPFSRMALLLAFGLGLWLLWQSVPETNRR